MDIKSLRVLFDDGALISNLAIPVGEKQWVLQFERRNGGLILVGTSREPDTAKIFKSLDATAVAAEEVGFSEMKVSFKSQVSGVNQNLF